MKLFPHQESAIQWLSARDKAILALDMGLGKTCVSSMCLVTPAIVVCPASLKLNWQRELQMWRPELSTQVIKSSKDQANGSDVTIINYDILQKVDLPNATTLVVDEAHYIKNYKSKRTKVLMAKMKATPKVFLLTGTPVVNRPIELWTLLYGTSAIKQGYFEFGMRYCAGWKTPWNTYDFSGSSRHAELVKVLEPVMLRMTKEEHLKDLPDKTYKIVELDLPIDKREKDFTQEQIEKPESVAFEAIADILKLNAERKLPDAVKYIKDALETTQKVVVFAHHKHIVDGLVEALEEFKPVKVTGEVKNEDRQKAVDKFQTNPDCRVFVGNIKAAGVGLTLTAASHVIFVEASWSPADIQQAADRCHRIGQKSAVTVDILTISGSIDCQVLHSVLTKMDVIDKIVKNSCVPDQNTLYNSNSLNQTKGLTMSNSLIAAKLRELAELFEGQSQDKTVINVKVEAGPAKELPPAEVAIKAEEKPAKQTATTKVEAAKAEPKAEYTLNAVRTAMATLIGGGKRDRALEILAELGVAKVSDIPEDKFVQAMEAIAK